MKINKKILELEKVCISPSQTRAQTALTESSGLTPRLRRDGPSYAQLCCLGELNTLSPTHTHAHTHNEAIWPHTIHLHSDPGLTKENKRYTFLKYYSLARDCPRLVWDSWNKSRFKMYQGEQAWGDNNGTCMQLYSKKPHKRNTYCKHKNLDTY